MISVLTAAFGAAALNVKVQMSVAVRFAYTESGRLVSLPLISKMSRNGNIIYTNLSGKIRAGNYLLLIGLNVVQILAEQSVPVEKASVTTDIFLSNNSLLTTYRTFQVNFHLHQSSFQLITYGSRFSIQCYNPAGSCNERRSSTDLQIRTST